MKIKKVINKVEIDINAINEVSDTKVDFGARGLTITDNKEQHNGTKYNIKNMKIDDWNKKITTDHSQSVEKIVGNAIGLKKIANRVVIEGIEFATEHSALAKFTKDMLMGGFISDVSIETQGTWPDEDGIYQESSLLGLSMVVAGNNKAAHVNAQNSLDECKKLGLDTEEVEKLLLNKNSVHKTKSTNKSNMIKKKKVEKKEEVKAVTEDGIAKIVNDAMKPVTSKIEELEQNITDGNAKAPSFKPAKQNVNKNEFDGMGYREIAGEQVINAWNFLKKGSADAGRKLEDLNKFNYERLLEADVITNQMTLGDCGNFVISPELLSFIEGHRSDFSALVSKINFQETLSLQMAWLTRSGDISMTEVENCDDGADGNLKPVSEYTAAIRTSDLQELAAVTPVCNAATRFLAADMMGDIAAGYRNDYDRKKAQLVIARLQQAA